MTETPDDLKALAERDWPRLALVEMQLERFEKAFIDLRSRVEPERARALRAEERAEELEGCFLYEQNRRHDAERDLELILADRSAREERIRQDAAEDERDRLFEESLDASCVHIEARTIRDHQAARALDHLRSAGAMSTVARAILRARQPGPAGQAVNSTPRVYDMTDAELAEDLTKTTAAFEKARLSEGGGSPGEWQYERMCEIETEQKRRARQPEPQRQEGWV